MHDFKYKNNQLCCEKIKVHDLVERFGTPLHIYSYNTLTDHYIKLRNAFSEIKPLICYSVKANSNLAILKVLVDKGAGLDIVSGGELFRALKAGCPAKRIVYASVGKTEAEIATAISKGILFFNVESLSELRSIDSIAGQLDKITRVAIRINPDVEAKTHKFITTGKITNKFGIDLNNAYKILLLRNKFRNVKICGLHIHIGSQITESAPFVAAIEKVTGFIKKLGARGIKLEYLNIGGGLGIIYDKEAPQTAQVYADEVVPLLKSTGLSIIMEPGRFIVGNAGILVAKVLYIKTTPKKKFIIVDCGMNDLIRPALYDAYHNILPLRKISKSEKADLVGPICESGDFLAKERLIAKVKEGDYLAVMSTGAYGFSMSSNYNSRLRAAEVMVNKNKVSVIRKRETYADIVRNELFFKAE
ncbi:MAG: diaminopimelate decarboxylase [Candidatus Omnitrophica bacterium]|nr:diaminopimelate decarboxylase [Candidatus Omnitrophota bacterium]